MKWFIKHKILSTTFIIIVLIVSWYFIGHHESLGDIKAYKGDGQINYLPKHGVFGIDGCEIKMQPFDLSKEIDVVYNLASIPKGSGYMIYLVVPTPSPHEKIIQGTLSYSVTENGKTIITKSSQIRNIINGVWTVGNWFYFLDGYFSVDKNDQQVSLSVKCINEFLDEPVEGYIVISRGGYK